MAPPRRNPQPPHSDAPDIARAIEAMVTTVTQQSNNMMQQHEVSMQPGSINGATTAGDVADGGCEGGC